MTCGEYPELEKEDFDLIEKFKSTILEFRDQICYRADEIDPRDERYWWEMSYGWFLGKGINSNDSASLASIVRYTC